MTSSCPIILLDDDEEERKLPQHEQKKDLSANEQEETFINDKQEAFLQVMGSNDRSYAKQMLLQANQNLETAILLALEGHDDGNAREEKQSEAAVASKTQSETRIPAQPAETLSSEWHHQMAQASAGDGIFVDPDFPPIASSLDGRKRSDTAASTITTCLCGLPATARTVQKDGPNYGRFYLACGKKGSSEQKCGFFQWDHDGSAGTSRYSDMAWHRFGPPDCVLSSSISPDHVRQGAVGNCWFLSALAVIAEKPYLIQKLLPHTQLNTVGCYQVNLCLDGKWTPLIIDSSLPVVAAASESKQKFKGRAHRDGFVPAFCAVPGGQLWPALVEKAYAKAHGSYAQLSGGFIAEALQDMTGAPTETLVFQGGGAHDELWARLLSFSEAGFAMGVATSHGGDGLVGGHAYSVLNVLEFHDVVVGEQQRVTDFFTSGKAVAPPTKRVKKTVRLLRIRNPWGKKEWKGEWSVDSDKWTTALRKRLGGQSFAKGDGTFFMSFEDMWERFHHMDVCKCREGWKHSSVDGLFSRESIDPLVSSQHVYRLKVSERTWAFISLVQPKKRANTKRQYWYGDPSMLILKRRRAEDEWSSETSAIHGCTRSCTSEIFLDPDYEYIVFPFSYHSQKLGGPRGSPFRITAYSSAPVTLLKETVNTVKSRDILKLLHMELLREKHAKLQYAIARQGLLLSIHGQDCLYFVALNAAKDHYLSIRLTLETRKGMLMSHGQNGDTIDVPPRAQQILMVASSDGTDSAAVSVTFSYICDTVSVNLSKPSAGRKLSEKACLGSAIELSMAGDLLASEVASDAATKKGGDTVETLQWLGQVGSSL